MVPLTVDEQWCDCRVPIWVPASLFIVTPSHQSPTTVTMPLAASRAITQAGRGERYSGIIEDDYESEINFVGDPTPALKSLDASERVIYVGSLSKTLAPGPAHRLHGRVAQTADRGKRAHLRRLMVRHPPANNQRIVALFLSMGHHDSLIHRLSETYKNRWQVMGDALNRLPARVVAYSLLWRHLLLGRGTRHGLDTRELKERARAAGILIESGEICFMQDESTAKLYPAGIFVDQRQTDRTRASKNSQALCTT